MQAEMCSYVMFLYIYICSKHKLSSGVILKKVKSSFLLQPLRGSLLLWLRKVFPAINMDLVSKGHHKEAMKLSWN